MSVYCKYFLTTSPLKSLKIIHSLGCSVRRRFYYNDRPYVSFGGVWDINLQKVFCKDMQVIFDFLSEKDEKSLVEEAEKLLKRLRYEYDHWDNAIHGYRETEHLHWNEYNMGILKRVQKTAFHSETQDMKLVHILDLAENGFIKPHVDSIKFCGNTIAGLSLLSDSVMRLCHTVEKDKVVDVLLKQRSLYIMKGIARYEYTHEILGSNVPNLMNYTVHKSRRVSVICRSMPEMDFHQR
ncbi:alpha-ketoglutarate-dependent dioxygenase alkB homolog 7, mitochondrial [Bacillus rossius redtenbacheri]|uniref:alpha-ketoglutarate-dependent dioxygenase alkB homolog 7, mitochondrial n=1 Tax=Bacillus rossius redtenbacheri TaxID=93214 RepID=UPI002FDE6B50